jgi:hypothetical protein
MTGARPERSQAHGAPASFKEEFAWVPDHGECPPAYIECGMQTASQRQSYDRYAKRGFCALQRGPAKNIEQIGKRGDRLSGKIVLKRRNQTPIRLDLI